MAQAPSGTDVADWDGSGDVWFKVLITIILACFTLLTYAIPGRSTKYLPLLMVVRLLLSPQLVKPFVPCQIVLCSS